MSLINIRTSSKGYKKDIGELTFDQYNTAIQRYLKWMANTLLDVGSIILCGLGKVEILGRERDLNRLRVDFVQTKKLGKTVYHLNEHTDGITYSFRWFKSKVRVRYKFAYKLIISKPNRRTLFKLVTQHNKEYRIL